MARTGGRWVVARRDGGVRACAAQLASIGCIGELKWLRAVAIVVWEGALVILWFRVRYDL
jgi:hypothetical protein